MTGNQNNKLPFPAELTAEEEDDEVFSSVSVSKHDHDDTGVFSSAPAEIAPTPRHTGAYQSVPAQPPSPTGPHGSVQLRTNTAALPAIAPMTGGYPSVQVGAPRSRARIGLLTPQNQLVGEVDVQGERFLIGREGSDLPLDDPFVSRWHAQITTRQGALMLEDLESHNGVYLRIADAFQLEDGDEMIIGQQRFIFHDKRPPPALPGFENGRSARTLGGPRVATYPHLIHLSEDGHMAGLYPIAEMLHIGRSQGLIRCPQDPCLEYEHATIAMRHVAYYIEDHNTQFGTYIRVNSAVELFHGDCFMLGRTRLTVTRA